MSYSPDVILFPEVNTTVSPPPVGSVLFYAKTDGSFYSMNSDGLETVVLVAGIPADSETAAPVTIQYYDQLTDFSNPNVEDATLRTTRTAVFNGVTKTQTITFNKDGDPLFISGWV